MPPDKDADDCHQTKRSPAVARLAGSLNVALREFVRVACAAHAKWQNVCLGADLQRKILIGLMIGVDSCRFFPWIPQPSSYQLEPAHHRRLDTAWRLAAIMIQLVTRVSFRSFVRFKP